jgi:hypothetical protein
MEFVSTTPAYVGSVRHAMRCDGSEVAEWLAPVETDGGTNILTGADNQNASASGQVRESAGTLRFTKVLTSSADDSSGR